MLSPISLQAATSCQADALTNAVIIGFIALVLYKIKHPSLLLRKEKILITAFTLTIALSKIVYLPICLLIFLLPKTCFQTPKQKYFQTISLILVAGLMNLVWLIISSGYLVEFQPGVDSSAQVQYILTHPHHYLAAIFRTLEAFGPDLLIGMFGPKLGYLNIPISVLYVIFFIIFTIYTYLREHHKALPLRPSQKALIATVILACVALIFTSLYVQWTAVGQNFISGLQGRYFIPLLPLVFFLITPLVTRSSTHKDNTLYVFTLIFAINFYALSSIIYFYMG